MINLYLARDSDSAGTFKIGVSMSERGCAMSMFDSGELGRTFAGDFWSTIAIGIVIGGALVWWLV